MTEATGEVLKVGGSLKVPLVQELHDIETVPSRYVCSDQDPPSLTISSTLPQIPVIDFHNLLSSDPLELEKFHLACKEWGFFQLINHGVSNSLVEKMKLETEEFFKLPSEEKKKYGQKEGEIEGYGQAFVMSEEQKLDWADMFFLTTLPAHLRKPHLFCQLPLSFRNTLEAYSTEMKSTTTKILKLMAYCLEMNPEDVAMLFEEGSNQSMRINYYPPCPEPEKVIGLSPHSDAGGLTILLQANEVEGLQIKKDGVWIPVKATPSAFVINIGDSLEVLTNGNYPSIEHRATVNSEKARISIATFSGANFERVLGPAPSLLSSQNSEPKFKRISVADYYKGYLSQALAGKSYLDTLRI